MQLLLFDFGLVSEIVTNIFQKKRKKDVLLENEQTFELCHQIHKQITHVNDKIMCGQSCLKFF